MAGQAAESISKRHNQSAINRINCSTIEAVKPVNIALMKANESMTGIPGFPISFGWWESRLNGPNFEVNKPVWANDNVNLIQRLLWRTPGSVVDVGANVGFMTNVALAMNRTVYGIEPVQYNVAKLCEANRLDFYQRHGHLQLYQAAAGPSFQPILEIARPPYNYFDRASLTFANVPNQFIAVEKVPMITVDSIVPLNTTLALVKIDVQGHEYGVLQGMHHVLSKVKPTYILYESDYQLTKQAGFDLKKTEVLVESYGYACTKIAGDTLCQF